MFVLSATEAQAHKEAERCNQVGKNIDSLFAQVEYINKNQQHLEVQFGLSNSLMEQMLKDQQTLAKQMEAKGMRWRN